MSPTKGMCVHHPINIKVFKRTFLKVDLPRSAIRLEQLEVKATLYNYANLRIGVSINTTLFFNNNTAFNFFFGRHRYSYSVNYWLCIALKTVLFLRSYSYCVLKLKQFAEFTCMCAPLCSTSSHDVPQFSLFSIVYPQL